MCKKAKAKKAKQIPLFKAALIAPTAEESGHTCEKHTCGECGECKKCGDCSCKDCPSCDKPSQNFCENCEHCDSCCECAFCESCEKKVSEKCSACDKCSQCCECCHCGRCHAAVEYTCGHCERCEDCCSCSCCDSCGERCSETCGSCSNCSDCCDCEKGPRANQKFVIRRPTDLKGYKTNSLRRPVAIELELSSLSDSSPLLDWAHESGAGLVEDGSIPDKGCEINTNPASGDVFLSEMKHLSHALKESGGASNEKCGLHVHIDASDYSQYDLRRLVMLWSLVERAMFDLAGKRRIESHYCQPSAVRYVGVLTNPESITTVPAQWRKGLAASLYDVELGAKVARHKQDRYNDARYYALNIHSFFFRKTIEFRLHEGTTDKAALENWPLVCGHIVSAALKMRESDLLALARSNQTAMDILCGILPLPVRTWVRDKLGDRLKARRQFGTEESVNASLEALDEGRRNLVQWAERTEFVSALHQDANKLIEYREAV